MITKYSLLVFHLETAFDTENQFEVKRHDKEDAGDVRLERLQEIEQKRFVQVSEVQRFNFMDFEFIQKLQEPKRTFKLQIYNKLMNLKDVMPSIQIECTKDDQFFIMTHLIER